MKHFRLNLAETVEFAGRSPADVVSFFKTYNMFLRDSTDDEALQSMAKDFASSYNTGYLRFSNRDVLADDMMRAGLLAEIKSDHNSTVSSFGREYLDLLTTTKVKQKLSLLDLSTTDLELRRCVSIAKNLRKLAQKTDDEHIKHLTRVGERYFRENGNWYGAKIEIFSKTRVSRAAESGWSGPDYYIVTGNENLLAGLFSELGYAWLDNNEENPCMFHRMAYGYAAEFAMLWENGLGWNLDIHFVKELYIHLAKLCIAPPQGKLKMQTKAFDTNLNLINPDQLYFSYGSNMNVEQMAFRCPGAQPVALAGINNFEFFINSGGVASIKPSVAKVCHGIIWKLTEEHWKTLDQYEGVESGCYSRVKIKPLINNKEIPCTTYIARDKVNGLPRPGYLEGIIEGAAHFNGDPKWIKDLRNHFNSL